MEESKIADYTVEPVRRPEVGSISTGDYQALQSRISIVKEIMGDLKNFDINRIGVYGIGGVGKTTLVKEVYKQAEEQKLVFDDVVILLDVKRIPDLEGIQKKIVEELSMDVLDNETMDTRANRLRARIKDKKILVIMDNVWGQIDLEAVGLPTVATCKILLTSRSRKVLSDMSTQKDFMLDILEEDETWVLFEKMAGDVVKNPAIRKVATKVAKYCRGFPILVVTVASALKGKITLAPWKVAFRCLHGSHGYSEEWTGRAYLGIEWSYSQLTDKELKQLFLLAGSTVEGNNIILKDLLNYSIGLGFFGKATMEEARKALNSGVEKLKELCLLIDNDDDKYVGMSDLVHCVANHIAFRDESILSLMEDGGDREFKEWSDSYLLKNCTIMSFPSSKDIPRLPEVMHCPALKMFLLQGDLDHDSQRISPRFFEKMKNLQVLSLRCMTIIPSLPPSFQSLKNLDSLCLDKCILGDVALIGELSNLEILSLSESNVKQLPKEVGHLTHLRLLDLSDCSELEFISPGIISSLGRLEELRMRNSFNKWEVEGKGSNASLSELKQLSQLSALEIHIPNADILPAKFFSSHKLKRFNILIGDTLEELMRETTLNTLKVNLTTSTRSMDEDIKFLMKISEDLSLDTTEDVSNILHQLDFDLENLKHLQLRGNIDFSHIINRKVVFMNLTTLRVHRYVRLRFFFSFSMAKSLVELKHLEISTCHNMEEIVLKREYSEESMDNMFNKLEDLKLHDLPNLVRFCTGSYIEFQALKSLEIVKCHKMGAFVPKEENRDLRSETVLQNFLLNEKVGFPRLERLKINQAMKLETIWHIQLAGRDSFRRLRQVEVSECDSLINIFPPSIMGRLNALETLKIECCISLGVVFELVRGSTVEEPRVASPNDQLKLFYCQNLNSVRICSCASLRKIFPASVARCLHQLNQLSVESCDRLEEIVGEEEEEGVLETRPPHFVFPKVNSVRFEAMPRLKKFYPGIHVSHWPSLKKLKVNGCDEVEIFSSEIFQGKQEPDPLTQQSLFQIDKASFPNLEYLELDTMEIWSGPSPAELVFGQLKSMHFNNCSPFSKQASIIFLQNLPNLKTIEVIGCSSKEICVDEGNSSSSGSETLPRIRKLKLNGIDNLMHLGGGIKAAVGQLFPNVEILEVDSCSGLKNLKTSAISFRNVTTLKVNGCKGLEYLMTYSVAESFVQLTTMEVRTCERIVVIVGSNIFGDVDPDDAAPNEITFSRLQHLTLSDLPSLRGFCSSGNCSVKFPSSRTLKVEFCSINFKISPDGSLLISRQSRNSTMKNIMDELKNPNTIRIGVWGIGGVGKTTVAKEVHKQATVDKKLFDDVVILLDVKSSPNSEEIQKKIVDKLGMGILDNETMEKRASRLRARIKDKKILVILDDVWKQIDLVAVGLPSVGTCKILLTSRIGKTLSDMKTQKEVLLDVLPEEESWDLFQEKAGDVVNNLAIRREAEQVVKNCGGLPVLVVIMASALKQITTLPGWKDASTCLQAGSDRGKELTEQAYLGIEWSYNQLNDKELKQLFLLCGITIRGKYISFEDLLRYSMGLGFFGKAFKVEEARDVLHSWIKKLKDFCLLTDNSDNRYVGMPDLVRDVANQIAFRDQHILSLVEDGGDRELKEWSEEIFLEKCTIMSFPSSKDIPRLHEVKHCPALKMFLLQGDLDHASQKISPRFFEKMKNLLVLSLRCMTITPSLPPSFQSLKNLDSLCLDKCILGDVALIGELSNLEILSLSESNVKQLPKEVGHLTHLRLLDLSDCSELEFISPGIISSLGRLEELRMRNSFNKWEVEGKGSNASLSELKQLSQLSALEIRIPNADILPANLFSHKLERFNIIAGDAYMWEKPMAETSLNTLKVKLTTRIEELDEGLNFLVKRSEDLSLYVEGMNSIVHSLDTKDFEHLKHLQLQSSIDYNYIINRKVVFPNLRTLRVHRCDCPSFLFLFSMPESLAELKRLEISTCEIMEESPSSTREYGQENMDNICMFSKREDLKLNELPNITRFCSGSIEKLDIEGWIKLGAYNAAMDRNTRIWNEIEETHSELITIQYFLFDLKAVFPKLTTLIVHECDCLSFLFSISMAKSLVELKHLEISTCEIIEEIVSSTSEYGQGNMENMFPKLKDLKLNKLPNLIRFCSGSFIQLPYLEKLDIQGCTKLGTFIEIEEKDSEENNSLNSTLFDKKIDLPKLTSLVVQRCDGLSFLSSMARSLVQLKHLVISECQIMVVLNEEYSEEKNYRFPELEQLRLNDLPCLDRFCFGSTVKFASLEELHIEKCTELKTFISNIPLSNSSASSKEMEERNTDQNIETVIQDFLFDKKVGFPKLERLTIIDLPKLETIWHTQIASDSFCKLQEVRVQQCNSLKTILPDSLIAGVFQQLQKLIVEECGVEEIISQGGGLEDQFVFPNLTCLEFRSLFQLKRFYPRMPAFSWPLLKTLVLLDCQKLDIFATEFSGLQKTHDTPAKQSSVLINENSFPKLENLTLVPMDIWYGRPTSAVCCDKAVFTGISNQHTDGSLPNLRTLRLYGMEKLMRLWGNTEPAGQEFPQLEILEVKFCGLNSLEFSLFFRNLTVLEVTFCWRLQYLTTYSVARSLRQLKKLKVDECKSMKEILASEGIGEDASNCEIVFSQLQHLELSDLISLERFCSSNCTVKVPNLETLEVNWCSIKLKFPSGILEVDSNMHLDVQKSHSSKEAFNTTESASSSERNQKQPATNASEGVEHIEFNARELHDDSLTDELNKHGPLLPGIAKSEYGVEGVIQETPINSQNMEHHEVMGLNQKQIVTNTSKNLQEADFGTQETLIEPLNANEGKQLQLKQLDGVQTDSWSQSMSKLDADIRRLEEAKQGLEEELRAKKAERRDKQQKQLATVDHSALQ